MSQVAEDTGVPERPGLRADARRNAEHIRRAAVDAFRGRGLTVPLEDVARAAGVSKGTIFNRFGGRVGLIEAVIEELVTSELVAILDRVRAVQGPGERLAAYVTALRDLQYRQPATNDVLLQVYPDSTQLMAICRVAGEFNAEVVAAARDADAVPAGFTAADLQAIVVDNALALKHGSRPHRDDYDRRTTYVLGGILGRHA